MSLKPLVAKQQLSPTGKEGVASYGLGYICDLPMLRRDYGVNSLLSSSVVGTLSMSAFCETICLPKEQGLLCNASGCLFVPTTSSSLLLGEVQLHVHCPEEAWHSLKFALDLLWWILLQGSRRPMTHTRHRVYCLPKMESPSHP